MTPTGTRCRIDDEEFARIRSSFSRAGDCLSDAQLLVLADDYHEMLRRRRSVRTRHTPCGEPASWAPGRV